MPVSLTGMVQRSASSERKENHHQLSSPLETNILHHSRQIRATREGLAPGPTPTTRQPGSYAGRLALPEKAGVSQAASACRPSVPKPSLAPVREVALLSSGSKCRDGPLVPGTRPSTFPLLGCMPLIHELLGGRGEGAATWVNHVWTLFSFKNSTGNNQKCLKLKYRRKFNAITFR